MPSYYYCKLKQCFSREMFFSIKMDNGRWHNFDCAQVTVAWLPKAIRKHREYIKKLRYKLMLTRQFCIRKQHLDRSIQNIILKDLLLLIYCNPIYIPLTWCLRTHVFWKPTHSCFQFSKPPYPTLIKQQFQQFYEKDWPDKYHAQNILTRLT